MKYVQLVTAATCKIFGDRDLGDEKVLRIFEKSLICMGIDGKNIL